MELATNRPWLEKLNKISWNVLMPVMAVTFILFNTVINQWMGERIETLQNLLVIPIMLIFACNIFASPKKNIPVWLRANILVVIYFAVRMITLVKMDFEYSTIRTIFFEVFFIIGISAFTVGPDNKRNLYIKLYVWLEIVLTALSLGIYYLLPYLGQSVYDFAMDMTFLEKSGNAMLFSNPNTAGLMAGFSIVIAIACFNRNIFSNKYLIVFGIYNIAALILFGCRSSEIAIFVVLAILAANHLFRFLDSRKLAVIALIAMIMTLIPIYALITTQEADKNFGFTEIEYKVDNITTSRYVIWEECAAVQADNILWGTGSLKLEKEAREQMIADMDYDYYTNLDSYYFWKMRQALERGPHNGYIGMISCTGILGMILFFAIILQRMWKSSSLKKGNWYLLLTFMFVINGFESLFVLNRFFTCFYMFLLFAIDFNYDEDSDEIPSLEETE